MTGLAGGIEVLLSSARLQLAELRTSQVTVVFTVVQPAVLLLVALLPGGRPGADRAAHVAVGVLLTAFWTATVWGAASVLRRDRALGTLARSVTGVRDARLVVLGKGLGVGLVTVVLVTATLAATLALLRQPVTVAHPWWMAVGALVVMASGAAVGLLVGSMFVLTRHGPQVSSALMYPVFLLGGMLVPHRMLPAAAQWVSDAISLRWLQEFLSGAATGAVDLPALGIALGLTAGYAAAGSALFGRILTRARREATLDLV